MKKIRYLIARIINRLPFPTCWPKLVAWAEGLGPLDLSCTCHIRVDWIDDASCYCGKYGEDEKK